jgi:two-component system phosphate regulon response regulator PhoB
MFVIPTRRILVVEDEKDLAELVAFNLKKHGFQAVTVGDGGSALRAVAQQLPDLIILDLMLPVMSGLDVARQIRTNPKTAAVPILMLTARSDETDQLAGLSAGADDYVTKPFSMKVLLARVTSLLRRTPGNDTDGSILTIGPITADLGAHLVMVDGQDTKLTLTEFKLLAALLGAPKRVLSRNELIGRVMGPGVVVTSRTIDVHVAALRKKLERAGGMIRTIRGVGYQLLDAPPPAEGSRAVTADSSSSPV